MKKLSVGEYVRALERMKKSPIDRVGILGEFGVTGLGLTAGVALASPVAVAVGAATIAGSTTLASMLGGVLVATTPVGWVIGAGLIGGAFAFAVGRLIRSGAKSDTIRKSYIQKLERKIGYMRVDAQLSHAHETKMAKIITGIQYLVVNDHITQEKATDLIAAIERKHVTVDDAFQIIQSLLHEKIYPSAGV